MKHTPMGLLPVLATLWAFTAAAGEHGPPTTVNDYPTAARVEYVFGCMSVNGQTPDVLHKCACSIDVIAEMLPYERYQQAETVLSMRQIAGNRTAMFRESPWSDALVNELKQAQAESTLRCF